MLAHCEGFPLAHHSVFFSQDYRAEFESLFGARRVPSDPTIYVCAQDRDDSGRAAPDGPERLLVLVNAPAEPPVAGERDSRPPDAACLHELEQRVMARLARSGLSLRRQHPDETVIATPAGFAARFPATGGALYGAATHGWRASFERPGARTAIAGLYLAGGGCHPGAGVPMAAVSGRLAAEALCSDLDSTSR
jgi:1-hydroxycarotenoid 3,4-desaturase